MQDIATHFALENLGCTGLESRLVECPVEAAAEDEADTRGFYSIDYDYRFRDSPNPSICDPFSGTFARVACGSSRAAGMHLQLCLNAGTHMHGLAV